MCRVTVSAYEFLERFPDEAAARRHMEEVRWAGRPRCPFCGGEERIQRRKLDGWFRCLACQKDFTVRVGTIFERSHVPLNKWLYAMYLLATARKGVSSLQLAKELGVTQKTAWYMLQRLREACGRDDDDGQGPGRYLAGIVEADETYVGGKESNKHESRKLKAGRGSVGKTPVLGLRQRGGEARAKVISGPSASEIQAQVVAAVAPGAVLCTDEHAAYRGMPQYDHRAVKHSAKEYVDGMAHTNGIESIWAVLKRGFYGVYHSFSRKHLQRYLDEFTFRLNEGNCKVHTLDRIEALLRRAVMGRTSYAEITA
ncbi:MAG: IS1595 family transposase [Candidatus Zixiibacteriota bacterium]